MRIRVGEAGLEGRGENWLCKGFGGRNGNSGGIPTGMQFLIPDVMLGWGQNDAEK